MKLHKGEICLDFVSRWVYPLVKTRKKNSANINRNGNKPQKEAQSSSSSSNNNVSNNEQLMSMITNIGLKAMIPGMWCIVAALLPFAAFQWFGFAAFCKLQKHELSNFPASISDYGTKLNLTMPGSDSKPDWCSSDPPIPFLALGIFPPNFECWKFLLGNNSFFFFYR